MRRIEIHRAQGIFGNPGGAHELHGGIDGTRQVVEARVCRIRHETFVPFVHATQIRIATLGESPNQVQGGRRVLVARQQPLRVGLAGGRSKVIAVDRVTPIGRQGLAIAGLGVAGTWLGVLARHAPQLNHRQRRTVGKHHRHLQQSLNLEFQAIRSGVLESLGAVTAGQNEGLAAGGLSQFLAQLVHFPGENQGGTLGQALGNLGHLCRIRIGRLLGGRGPAPRGFEIRFQILCVWIGHHA